MSNTRNKRGHITIKPKDMKKVIKGISTLTSPADSGRKVHSAHGLPLISSPHPLPSPRSKLPQHTQDLEEESVI